VFESGLIPTNFRSNAAGLTWRATIPQGTQLLLELRGGSSGDQLGDWQPIRSGDAFVKGDEALRSLEAVRNLPADTNFIQIRATFTSTIANASPELAELNLSYYNTQAGPGTTTNLPRVAALVGAATLTPPPQLIERSLWSGSVPAPVNPARNRPRSIILHQIGDDTIDAPLPYLRALLNYQTKTLGYDDLLFHYLIDRDGNVYEGRASGPTARVDTLGSDGSAVQIALIGSSAPSSATLVSLHGLLAWLGQAYQINPLGKIVLAATERPTIVAHSEISATAGDPSDALGQLMPAIRTAADQATVRARWYFAEGNAREYAERLAVFNPTTGPATVRFILLRQPGPAVIRETTIPAGGRADLVVNDVFTDIAEVPAIVESNAAVIAERYMDFGSEISMSTGIRQPARVWYFAEGSTDGTNKTYLLLFNPQADEAQATITYIRDDGIAAEQTVRIPGLQRRVVVVGDKLSNATFGIRVVSTRPVVAERTMIFGQGSSLEAGGVHTAPGITTLSRRWYFAEGTTEAPFTMSILVLNPNAQPVDAAVTFMTPDGTSLTRRYAIPAATRLSIPVNDVVPQLGVATTVVTDRPVAVERAISWNNGLAGTASAGAIAPSYSWRFADGRTLDTFQQFLLVSNPGRNQARVTVEYTLSDGSRVSDPPFIMAGGSRQTVAVHTLRPGQLAIAATVRSSQPIVVERSLYRGDPRTADSRGGETVLGIPGE
jgi:hypothetical protein